jgi:hypothetical protein
MKLISTCIKRTPILLLFISLAEGFIISLICLVIFLGGWVRPILIINNSSYTLASLLITISLLALGVGSTGID